MSNNTNEGRARLGDYMCFAIYSTNLAYSRVYKPVLEQLGLTYPQYVTIICLWEEDKQTVKGLSEKLFLEPSTMTPMLKRLEAMGYVSRERDSEDERSVRVSLTSCVKRLSPIERLRPRHPGCRRRSSGCCRRRSSTCAPT
jgi:DNA-binding HxlR family transcriptional regulator